MELSQFSDYSLRVLIFVALQGDRRSSVKEIAEVYQISPHHLMKVVHKLGALGYLLTYRGRGGGIGLGRPAKEIVVGAVVRDMEHFTLVECFAQDGGKCRISPVCRLKSALGRARDAFLEELDRYTIADLVRPKGKLIELLEATAPPPPPS